MPNMQFVRLHVSVTLWSPAHRKALENIAFFCRCNRLYDAGVLAFSIFLNQGGSRSMADLTLRKKVLSDRWTPPDRESRRLGLIGPTGQTEPVAGGHFNSVFPEVACCSTMARLIRRHTRCPSMSPRSSIASALRAASSSASTPCRQMRRLSGSYISSALHPVGISPSSRHSSLDGTRSPCGSSLPSGHSCEFRLKRYHLMHLSVGMHSGRSKRGASDIIPRCRPCGLSGPVRDLTFSGAPATRCCSHRHGCRRAVGPADRLARTAI
jgi:hypothetical protein